MTANGKNLLVGFAVGFAWGLVVCSLVHAEPTIAYGPLGSFWDTGAMQREDQERRARLNRILSVKSCEQTMAEAMRAMDEFVQERTTTDAIRRSPGAVLREAADREDRREAALRQWDAAKACWGSGR